MKTRILSIGAVGFITPAIQHADSWEITKPEKPAAFVEHITQIKTYALGTEVSVSMDFEPAQSLCYNTKNSEGIEAYVLDDSGFAEPLTALSQSRDSVCYALPVLETTTTLTLAGTYANGVPLQQKKVHVLDGYLSEHPFVLESVVAPQRPEIMMDGTLVSFEDDNALGMTAFALVYDHPMMKYYSVELEPYVENTVGAVFLLPDNSTLSVTGVYAKDRNDNSSLLYHVSDGIILGDPTKMTSQTPEEAFREKGFEKMNRRGSK
ncbi:hypothetical protein HZC31_03935 [Candidatus Woesearchaeota archaeon]|nr:hypothetical protein [Candidatus Woesearchaeota archaeon]